MHVIHVIDSRDRRHRSPSPSEAQMALVGFDAANQARQLYQDFQVVCDETHAIQKGVTDWMIEDASHNLQMAQSRLSALQEDEAKIRRRHDKEKDRLYQEQRKDAFDIGFKSGFRAGYEKAWDEAMAKELPMASNDEQGAGPWRKRQHSSEEQEWGARRPRRRTRAPSPSEPPSQNRTPAILTGRTMDGTVFAPAAPSLDQSSSPTNTLFDDDMPLSLLGLMPRFPMSAGGESAAAAAPAQRTADQRRRRG